MKVEALMKELCKAEVKKEDNKINARDGVQNGLYAFWIMMTSFHWLKMKGAKHLNKDLLKHQGGQYKIWFEGKIQHDLAD